jgi:hypothetical protein
MPRYIVTVTFPSGKSFEKHVNATTEKAARQKVWQSLDSGIQDNVKSLEVVEILREYA